MAKDKDATVPQAAQADAEAVKGEPNAIVAAEPLRLGGEPHIIQVVTPVQKPAEAIPDFDKTVPGGHYVVNGVHVDAHGKTIPKGAEQQNPDVLARSIEDANDLSAAPVA